MYKKFVRNTLMMTVALLIVCGSAIFATTPITITIRPVWLAGNAFSGAVLQCGACGAF